MAPFKFFLDPRYGLMEKIHYLRHGTRNLAVVRMPSFRKQSTRRKKIWLSDGFKPGPFGSFVIDHLGLRHHWPIFLIKNI